MMDLCLPQPNDVALEVEASDADRLVRSPLVSVLMITYNHAEYLAEAIEGVLSQQCGFSFELIIGEDASSDTTRSVALHYQRRYPEIVRVIYSMANVGMNANARRIAARARGEYLAYCEGDDYWCSPHKLAGQIALIQSDPAIGIVHTDWVRSTRMNTRWIVGWNKSVHRRTPRRRLEGDIFRSFYSPKILRTCTILLRRSVALECQASELCQKDYFFGDTVYAAYITSKWKVGYLPEIAAVYRVSPNSALRSGDHARIAFLKSGLAFDTDANRYFERRTDYPRTYRWELLVGLSMWAIKARNVAALKFAWRDLRAHFGLFEFVAAGWRTFLMRRPTVLRQHRDPPAASSQLTQVSGLER